MLVTFIPLNNRVEKQAFGRTGRRGATGSCQIIVYNPTMPMQLKQCETVEDAKRLRDSIEMHRLEDSMMELDIMRNKQELFREYCKLKKEFVSSSNSDPDDLKVQVDILDETWAKWIQNYETMDPDLNHNNLIYELQKLIGNCSKRARLFESENIYHLLKFGAVRLIRGDFKVATAFYDQVIKMDSAWSAFAHYNRAYCTLELSDDGYIRHAIDDLKAAFCKLENYKQKGLFTEILVKRTDINFDYFDDEISGDDVSDMNHRIANYNDEVTHWYVLTEYQLLHHIDTQIIDCIEKLGRIDTMKGEVTTERQNILDLIPGADCTTMKKLHEYQQLGLIFTYNINEKPRFCYRLNIVSSLVILESVADILLMAFLRGILVSIDSNEVIDIVNAACNIGSFGDSSLGWILRCASEVINIGVHTLFFIRDISSLVLIKKTEVESCWKNISEQSQFSQFTRLQAASVLKWLAPETQKVCSQDDEILMHVADVAMDVSRIKISHRIRETIAPGQKLHREIFSLYGSVASQSKSDLLRFVEWIRDLAQLCSYSFEPSDADILTSELQKIAVELRWKCRDENIMLATSKITTTAEKINIDILIEQFSVCLCNKISQFQQSKACEYSCDDKEMFEAINNVLTSVWCDNVRFVIQSRISRSLMLDSQKETTQIYSAINQFLDSKHRRMSKYKDTEHEFSKSKQTLQTLSIRLQKCYIYQKKSYTPQMQAMTEANFSSKHLKRNIIFSDVDKETIHTISSPENSETCEFIYNPPSLAFPDGHYDASEDWKWVKSARDYESANADDDLFRIAWSVVWSFESRTS